MKLAGLVEAVADLTERVAALEASRAPTRQVRAGRGLGLVESIVDGLPAAEDGLPADGAIVYAGAGPGTDGVTAFQIEHDWNDVLDADPAPVAACLAALGNPLRIQILQMLVRRPATTAELTDALEAPSSGQLFHHLKELLAAGLVHQPSRGSYATRAFHVIPLLTALSCAIDLSIPADRGEP